MKLKSILLSAISIIAWQAPVFAEDYYVPTRKELEPMARIPLPEFTMSDEKINYILPEDITGRSIKLELTRDLSHGEAAFPRLYKGPNGTASCMGDNILPACVITHNDLGLKKDEVYKFLDTKYKDPLKRSSAHAVADQFISGNQPIGFISKRSILPHKNLPQQWNVQFLIKGRIEGTFIQGLSGKIDLTEGDQSFEIREQNQTVRIDNVVKHGLNVSGHINTGMKVWFDVTVNTAKNLIEGSWGEIRDGKYLEASGTVKGSEIVGGNP